AGIATFGDVSIYKSGSGYTLVAASGALTSATSTRFGVRFAFIGVTVGGNHTCSVTTGGALYCWGDNTSAELGDGTRTTTFSPVPIYSGFPFAMVSAGGYHTCAVAASAAAYCWGDNLRGQLGDGTQTDGLVPGHVFGGPFWFTTVTA